MSDSNVSIFDVLCIGDAVLDTFLQISEASAHCHINEKNSELCIQYGGKIPVDDCQFLVGGDGANVSIGLSRLGFDSGLMAEIGDDEFCAKIVNTLKKEKVDTSYVIQTPHAPSTFSVIINFKKERTIFSRHIQRKHLFDLASLNTQWVYLTSLGEEWQHVYDSVVTYVKKLSVKLAFNPGSNQLEGKVSALSNILTNTDILFVNKEEAVKIANSKLQIAHREDMKQLLREVQNFGPKNVVITDGINGSYFRNEEGTVFFCPCFDSNVVERTGAGDGYATGFLGAILSNLSPQEAMRWGSMNAASVVQKIGAQVGLLTKKEIEKNLSENPELKAEELV